MTQNGSKLDAGGLELCLNVQDLEASIAFYSSLGFKVMSLSQGNPWRDHAYLLQNGLMLFLIEDWFNEEEKAQLEGFDHRTVLSFHGGDVPALAAAAAATGARLRGDPPRATPDGSGEAWVRDPDGRTIMLDTWKGGREQWLKSRGREILAEYDREHEKKRTSDL